MKTFAYFTWIIAAWLLCTASIGAAANPENATTLGGVAPVNDNCGDALALSLNFSLSCETSLNATTTGATPSIPAVAGCIGTADDDVWFRFTALNPRHRLKITGATGAIMMQVFSGTCGNFVSLGCEEGANGELEQQYENLTPSVTYYVRVYTKANGTFTNFNICLGTPPPPPANDACADADTLVVNTDLSCSAIWSGGTFGGLPTTPAPGSCVGFDDDELWFQFDAIDSIQRITLTSGYNSFVYQVYSGACGTLTQLYCSPEIPVNTSGSYQASKFIVGETYYIRAYTYGKFINSTFSICVGTPPDPPVNDKCQNATALTVNAGLTCSASLNGSTTGGLPAASPLSVCSGATADDEVWYRFTATATSHRVQLTANTATMFFQGFSGSCNAPTQLSCSPAIAAGTSALVQWENLTVGQTYRIRVYTQDAFVYGTFTLCILTPPTPPVNSNCSGAVLLSVDPDLTCNTPYNQTTYEGLVPYPGYSGCVGTDDDDLWFRFVATKANHRIQVSNGTEWMVLQTFSGSCSNWTSIDCYDAFNGNFERLITGLTPGQTYHYRLYTRNPTVTSAFSTCVLTPPDPPSNDLCSSARVLSSNLGVVCTNPLLTSTTGATPSKPDIISCGGDADDDVWFRFEATSPRYRLVVSQPDIRLLVQVFSGSCASLDEVYCSEEILFGDTAIIELNNLDLDDQYFVRVYTDFNLTFGNFKICLAELPANDDCALAKNLTVNPGQVCTSSFTSTSAGCTPSNPPISGCVGQADDDQWFRFTATATSHFVNLKDATGSMAIQVFSGNCNGLQSLSCIEAPSGAVNKQLYGLTVGATYRLRVYTQDAGATTAFTICVTTPPPPPANDNCAGATVLSVNSNLLCTQTLQANTSGGLPTLPALAVCLGVADDDVWYRFTATSSSHRIKITNASQTVVAHFYSGTCANLDLLACLETTGGNAEYQLNGLTAGATYFIRAFSKAESTFATFNLCVGTPPAPPVNDGCQSPVVLSVNANLNCAVSTSSTTIGATSDNPLLPTCLSAVDDDVWFRFTATAASHRIKVTGATDSMGVELFSGTCNGLVSLGCMEGEMGLVEQQYNALSPGTTYFIRVYTVKELIYSNFTICVGTPPAPPANDLCNNAIALTINANLVCAVSQNRTTSGGTPTNPPLVVCGGVADDDVWFRFVATASSHRIKVTGGGQPLAVQGFSGSCASLVSIGCNTSSTDSVQLQLDALTIGSTYRVRVFSTANLVYSNFTICVGVPPAPPANDACANAVVLSVNADLACGQIATATTTGATPNLPVLAACSTAADDDVWFRFEATNASHRVKLAGGAQALSMQAFSGACGNFTQIKCLDSNFGGGEMQLDGLTVGSTYYVRVYTKVDFVYTTFTICIGTPPPPPANDACADALALPVNNVLSCPQSINATTSGATAPDSPVSGCTGSDDDDVWFKFTASSSSHRLEIYNGSADIVVQVFTGSCNSLAGFWCDGGTGANFETQFDGLTVGATYFIRVYTWAAFVPDSFTICLGTPPPPPVYDDCATAAILTVNDDLDCAAFYTGSTFGAFPSSPLVADCGGVPEDDTWFQFTATDTIHRLKVSDAFNAVAFQVFSGSCGDLEQIFCMPNIPINGVGQVQLTGLVVGEIYFVRVYTVGKFINTSFKLCVGSLPQAPANDRCNGAFNMAVNPDLLYADSLNATTLGALPPITNYAGCSGADDNDVWFKFVAEESFHRIKVSNGAEKLIFQLLDGDCNDLSQLSCSQVVPALDTAGEVQWNYFTPGETYYVRVYTYEPFVNTDFTIAVGSPAQPPVNDVCAGAILLTINPDLNCGTTVSQTSYDGLSPNPPVTGCAGADDDDMWYRFVATAPSHRIRVVGSNAWLVLESFSGTCGNLTQIDCYDAFSNVFERQLNRLTIGETYLVRLYTRSADLFTNFSMCIGTPPPAPANDLCNGAIELAVNAQMACNNTLNATTTGGTPSVDALTSCGGEADDDVWYHFTATAENHRLSIFNGIQNLHAVVYAGDCDSLEYLICSTVIAAGDSGVVQINGITVGDNYYVRVYTGNILRYDDFIICLSTPPVPPANDRCANAIDLPVNTNLVCTNTLTNSSEGGLQSNPPLPGCVGFADDDVWFSFVAASVNHYVTVNGNTESIYFQVFSGSCGNLTPLKCSFGSETLLLESLVAGDTYYVRVYTNSHVAYSSFVLCVTTPPPPPVNDNCPGAINLSVQNGLFCGDPTAYYGQYATPGAPANCAGSPDDDLWFRFDAEASQHVVQLGGGMQALRAEVFSGGCANLAPMACSELVQTDSMTNLTLDSLTEGQTYFIRVFSSDSILPLPGGSRGDADRINLCGFHWIPLQQLEPFKSIRVYIPTGWMWRPDGLFVEPLFQGSVPTVFGYDTYLTNAKAQNLEVVATLNQTPDWYAGLSSGIGSNDFPPIKPGLDRADPASYQDFAEFMWQMTARYGRVNYPDSVLRVDTMPRWVGDIPNVPKSGLDLLNIIEVWNEPDKWWKLNTNENDAYMQPEEYAAMLSICYDSIKSADPTMKVVMAGLAGIDLVYLNRMKTWFEANRDDGIFPADAINVHFYNNLATQFGGFPWQFFDGGGMCPELDVNFYLIDEANDFCSALGKELWITEFGYDTRLPSPQYAAPVGGFTSEELQAQWLVRIYLEYIRYGVDNMYMYNGIDEPNAENGGLYQNCGLIYASDAPEPYGEKQGYLSMVKLIEELTEVQYEEDLSTSDVRIMAFRKKNGGRRLVYWSPTMSGTSVSFTVLGSTELTATEWPQAYDEPFINDFTLCVQTPLINMAFAEVKVFLQGPYVSSVQLMQDSLRAKGLISLTEPYSGLSNFTHVGGGGGEQTTPDVLAVTGPDAIVDWVFLELRSAVNPAQVVCTRSALLQRDGDVVDVDGFSPVGFIGRGGASYYLTVRHRNHLGVQLGQAKQYAANTTVYTDFTTLLTTDMYTNNGLNAARRLVSGRYAMWAGNGRTDRQVKYNGGGNDRSVLLSAVGIATPNNIVSGYNLADYNMDGLTKYNGSSNDRNVLLGNVGISTPSAVVHEQTAY